MSTYTNIKNRIKENIAANVEDREVSAKTVFVNPENIYYGTFIGDVTASSLVLPDDFLQEQSFDSPVLVNPVLSSYISSYEDGVSSAKLEIGDILAVSCAVRAFKTCLMQHFMESDPMQYDGVTLASALIDLKNSLSGF